MSGHTPGILASAPETRFFLSDLSVPDFSDGDPMDSAGFMILKTLEISSETLKHLKKPPAVFF